MRGKNDKRANDKPSKVVEQPIPAEVLFPPYDDHFTFDIFSTSVEDLLLIATPNLCSLTEQSLEDDAKEIEILEKQLSKINRYLSSLDSHLSSLRQSFVSLSI
mmetsp:Transcript_94680/g.141841  ORF Transcript_94680/g.141841 Transcript_94680/m.141841 type:complete len:103 (+) Transcript_94680:615-923(+)